LEEVEKKGRREGREGRRRGREGKGRGREISPHCVIS